MRGVTFIAACALCAGLTAVGRAAEPVTLTVRFIDARNGRPFTGMEGPYEITFLRRAPTSSTVAETRAINLGTIRVFPDSNGVMRFTLPTPMPGVIEVLTWWLGCSPVLFDAKEVIEKGVVGKNLCRTKWAKKNVKFEAKPGEIIYFMAPLSFWDRLDHAIFF